MKESESVPHRKEEQRMHMISREIIAKNRWTTIVQEEFKTETGKEGNYLIVERKPALMIIPIIKENDTFFTYLVKQHRYPIAKEVWQFPMGTLDENAELEDHAKKELQEETGLLTDSMTFMGSYFIDPGLSRQECRVYIAQNIIEGGEQNPEETEEGMIAQRFSLEELEKLIADNQLIDGWIYPGIYFLKQFLMKKG